MAYGEFGGEEYVSLGIPSIGGSSVELEFQSCYAISSQCENKDYAADFVRYIANLEYSGSENASGFAVTKKGREKQEQFALGPQHYDDMPDYSGCVFWAGYDSSGKSVIIKTGSITQGEIDKVNELIDSCTVKMSTPNLSYRDIDKISGMIYEETEAFFAGDITLDKCVEYIQDRVSTFLSETI